MKTRHHSIPMPFVLMILVIGVIVMVFHQRRSTDSIKSSGPPESAAESWQGNPLDGDGSAGISKRPSASVARDETSFMNRSGMESSKRLSPSRIGDRRFPIADAGTLVRGLSNGQRAIHERMRKEFPTVDWTDVEETYQAFVDKRATFPLNLDETGRLEYAEWLTEAEAVCRVMVEARAQELGLAISGVENGRGFYLFGFREGVPSYTYTSNVGAAVTTGASFVRWNPGLDPALGTSIDGGELYVNINDHGTIYEHPEFQLPNNGGSRILVKEINDGGSRDHMTHVAGTVAAWGYNSSLEGMAPRAWYRSLIQQSTSHITSYAMAVPGQTMTVTNPRTGKLQMRSVVGNTSLGGGINTRYSSTMAGYDGLMRDYPYYVHCFSAGNSGSNYETLVDPWGGAKNVFTIGAANGISRDSVGNYTGGGGIASFSSRGPTFDGRIKPDFVGKGVSVLSSVGLTGSAYYQGTSMSSPNVAGSVAILMDYVRQRMPDHFFRSSTYKALLMNTADDLGNPGPDYIYGWGAANVHGAAKIVRQHATSSSSRVLVEDALAQGQTWTQAYSAAGSGAIRVSLAWLDPAGTSVVGEDRSSRLVNDLDLRVTGPNGIIHQPFVMPFTTGQGGNPAYSAALYAANAMTGDNVTDPAEQVLIAAPTTGTYTVRITHKGNLRDSQPQLFSLAVTGMASSALAAPQLAAITPAVSNGGSNQPVAVSGSGYVPGSDLIFRRAGQSDVRASGVRSTGGRIEGLLNGIGMAGGYWDVVVRHPDGRQGLLSSGFFVPGLSNNAPVANAQNLSTPQGVSKAVTLTGSDPDNDPLTYAIVSQPSKGTLSGTPPNVTYTPQPAYTGSDSFTFKVNDGKVDSPPATVTIQISPAAQPGSIIITCDNAYELYLNGSLIGTGSNWNNAGQFTNLPFVSGSNVIAIKGTDQGGVAGLLAELVVNGQRTGTGTGWKVSLSAPTGWKDISFDDSAWSAARDYGAYGVSPWSKNVAGMPGDTSVRWIWSSNNDADNVVYFRHVFNASAPNIAPVANAQTVVTQQNVAKAIALTATDSDGDPLTYAIVASPTKGSLSGTPPDVTYTPQASYNGSDSFTFKVNDGKVDSAPATVSITVTPSDTITPDYSTRADGYTVARFSTGSGTWTIPTGVTSMEVLVVGGGGSGAAGATWAADGGGGGGVAYLSNFSVIPGSGLSVSVGNGGAACSSYGNGASGGQSRFGELTAQGGEGGLQTRGGNSGGLNLNGAITAGGYGATHAGSNGGGGAGQNGSGNYGASPGGNGITFSITGTASYYGGGGGGGYSGDNNTGGLGGGGKGATDGEPGYGHNGVNGLGGGGGASRDHAVSGAGGSGVVIVAYRQNSDTITPVYSTRSDGATVATFTSGSGTWTVPAGVTSMEVLVVGGGGGGGTSKSFSNAGSGGGGAGGLIHISNLPISPGPLLVEVGSGGVGAVGPGHAHGVNGGDSKFGELIALGGGGGAGGNSSGRDGGSGGGSRDPGFPGGKGLQPIQAGPSGTYGYGTNGATGSSAPGSPGNGGGGAGAAASGIGGGAGKSVNITGTSLLYAGGGGGGGAQTSAFGVGGSGGGGDGGNTSVPPKAGLANTGSGGGGGNNSVSGAGGGSGVVIVVYRTTTSAPSLLDKVAGEPVANHFQEWVARHDVGMVPDADDDGDGLSNFHEFAFGLDPRDGSSSDPVVSGLDPAIHSFRYSRYADSGLSYTVWTSTDLQRWDGPADVEEKVGPADEDGVVIVEARLKSPPVEGNFFIRLKAEKLLGIHP